MTSWRSTARHGTCQSKVNSEWYSLMPEVWKEKQSLWKDLSQFRTQVADTDDTVLNSCTCWMSSSNYQTRTMTIRSQRCAIRMISAGQWLDFLQHQTSPTSEKTRPCCSIVVSGNKKFSQLKFWLPVFASGCWTNRSCSHSMGLVCTNWRELRSAATQLVWQEGPNTMQRNSLPLNSPLACVSGVEVKSLIHQSPKDEASSQICCHLC